MNRSARICHGFCESLIQKSERTLCIVYRCGELGDEARKANLIEVLEMSLPGSSGRTGAAEQQHGSAVEVGIGHTSERIDLGDAARNSANAGLAREATEGVSREPAGLLVPYIYQAQAGLAGGIQQRIQTVAAQRGNPLDAALAKALYHQIRRSHLVTSSRLSSNRGG
jgi:hypothetical protein